jgi:ankyrin
MTALHCAFLRRLPHMAQLLIDRGARLDATRDPSQRTALHDAAEGGMTETIRYAYRQWRPAPKAKDTRPAIDVRTSDGMTPLHCAARRGSAPTIELLLELGASPSTASRMGWTPLHCALMSGSRPAVVALLRCGTAALNMASVATDINMTAPQLAAALGVASILNA